MISIPTKPQATVALLKTSFRIWLSSFKTVLPFLLLLIILLMTRVALIFLTNPEFILNPAAPHIVFNPIEMVFSLILWILLLILIPGMLFSMHKSVKNNGVQFSTAMLRGFRKALPLLMVSILSSLIVLIGSVFLIIPGLIAAIYLLPSYFIIVVTDKGVFNSLNYSAELVSGHWWRIAWLYALVITVFAILVSAFAFGVGYFLLQLHLSEVMTLGLLMSSILVFLSLLTEYLYAYGLAILYDLEVRKELEGRKNNKA